MGVLSSIGEAVLRGIDLSGKMRSLTRSDITDIIDENVKGHENIVLIKESFTKKELEVTIRNYKNNIQNSSDRLLEIPVTLHSYIRGEWSNKELTNTLSSVFRVNKLLKETMEALKKNIDDVIKQDTITLFNCRISHTTIFGLLQASTMFTRYVAELWGMVIEVSSDLDNYKHIPPYKKEFLIENEDWFTNLLNLVLNSKGKFFFMSEIDNIKERDLNTKLYINNTTIDNIVDDRMYTKNSLFIMSLGSLLIRCMGDLASFVDDIKYTRNERNKQLSEWIKAKAALHKLDLAKMDKDDPEYLKKQKIVHFWENKIIELDEKIEKYERS